MAEEAQPFLDALPERAAAQAPTLPGAARAWSLQLPDGERELILVRSGIGLVAAASALATVLAQVRPSADADATAFGYARGQTPGQPETFAGDAALLEQLEQVGQEALRGATASSGSARLRVGQMLAGNSFVTAANVADTREVFPAALSTDMESTALAQVAAGAGVPFVSVRGVSDLCGPEAGQDFHIAVEEAAARSAAVVLALLG